MFAPNKTELEFTLKDSGRKCKLTRDFGHAYKLWIDETLATDLPPAPPIAKDDIPEVC